MGGAEIREQPADLRILQEIVEEGLSQQGGSDLVVGNVAEGKLIGGTELKGRIEADIIVPQHGDHRYDQRKQEGYGIDELGMAISH